MIRHRYSIPCVSRPSRVGEPSRTVTECHALLDHDDARQKRIEEYKAEVAKHGKKRRDPIRVFTISRGRHRGKWAFTLSSRPKERYGPFASPLVARQVADSVMAKEMMAG